LRAPLLVLVRRKRDKSVSIDAPISADNDTTLADVIQPRWKHPMRSQSPKESSPNGHGMEKLEPSTEKSHTAQRKNLSYERLPMFSDLDRDGEKPDRPSLAKACVRVGRGLQMKETHSSNC